jgi:acyl carrier protein
LPNCIYTYGWLPSPISGAVVSKDLKESSSFPSSKVSLTRSRDSFSTNNSFSTGDSKLSSSGLSFYEEKLVNDVKLEKMKGGVPVVASETDTLILNKKRSDARKLLEECLSRVISQSCDFEDTLQKIPVTDKVQTDSEKEQSISNCSGIRSNYDQKKVSNSEEKSIQLFSFDEDAPFYQLGFDSVTAVEFTDLLSKRLKIQLEPTLVFQYPTLRDLVDFVVENHSTKMVDYSAQTPSESQVILKKMIVNYF